MRSREDLRATENGEHRAGRVVENLGEGRELLLNQRTRDLYVEAIANHRRMGAVRGAESIVHVNIRQGLQALAEPRVAGLRKSLQYRNLDNSQNGIARFVAGAAKPKRPDYSLACQQGIQTLQLLVVRRFATTLLGSFSDVW